jgi:broad specificity phosphatase PhoE
MVAPGWDGVGVRRMGRLVLVRHGRASFDGPEYDRLSRAGETQAARLGEYWARIGLTIDAIETGPRERHRRSAELAGRAYAAESGRTWPEPVVRDAWDEHAVDRALKDPALLARVAARFPEVGPLSEALAEASEAERGRAFQRLFEALTTLWSMGAYKAPDIPPWPAFREAVHRAIGRIVADPARGRTVAVFTSVGPITAALGLALDLPDRAALQLGWRLRNASLTEMVFSPGRLTLDAFNTLPHLDDPALWT